MAIVYHDEVEQGSAEWLDMRCGLPTASEMSLLVTPTLKPAWNDKERSHLFELAAQRITGHVPPRYVSDDMLRGFDDQVDAIKLYDKHYAKTHQMGFVTNDKWGFKIGYSPDALVDDDGLVECKSRNQKLQIKTLLEYSAANTIDPDFMLQVQTGLLVTERKWCDLISYSSGLPMSTIRVFPEPKIQDAIIAAVAAFEERMNAAIEKYNFLMSAQKIRLLPTERRIYAEIF